MQEALPLKTPPKDEAGCRIDRVIPVLGSVSVPSKSKQITAIALDHPRTGIPPGGVAITSTRPITPLTPVAAQLLS